MDTALIWIASIAAVLVGAFLVKKLIDALLNDDEEGFGI